jgi:hypothetical protein
VGVERLHHIWIGWFGVLVLPGAFGLVAALPPANTSWDFPHKFLAGASLIAIAVGLIAIAFSLAHAVWVPTSEAARRAWLRRTDKDGVPRWAKGGTPFVDYVDTPQARLGIKLDAVFAGMNVSRMVRARVRARVVLLEELGREPSHLQLETAAKSLYERNDTALDVTDDELRAYIAAGGEIPLELRPWNAEAAEPTPPAPPVAERAAEPTPRRRPGAKDIARPLAEQEALKRRKVQVWLGLRSDGLALRQSLQGLPWGERQEHPEFGADQLSAWLDRCGKAVSEHRPERLLDYDAAARPQALVQHNWQVITKATAALELWPERVGQIDRVVVVLDDLIRTTT